MSLQVKMPVVTESESGVRRALVELCVRDDDKFVTVELYGNTLSEVLTVIKLAEGTAEDIIANVMKK